MIVIGLDPGTEESALVSWDGEIVGLKEIFANEAVFLELLQWNDLSTVLAIEKIESFGMAVGRETFRTVFWSGRFAQAWVQHAEEYRRFVEVTRREVKLHICGHARATDSNIRQALIDRIGPIGTKKNQGPLYGVKGHEFAALAVAVTYHDQHAGELRPGIAAQF